MNALDNNTLPERARGAAYKSLLSDSLSAFYGYVAEAFGNDIYSFRNRLRSIGYGLPVTIPTLTDYNAVLYTMRDNVAGSSANARGFSAEAAKVSPIQLLAFYSGIANEGIMLTPILDINQGKVIVCRMASLTTVKTVQNLLTDDFHGVSSGYGDTDAVDAAGRFTLAKSSHVDWDTMKYRMEFCGYLPAENLRYTVLIILEKDELPAKAEFVYPLLQKIARTLDLDGNV